MWVELCKPHNFCTSQRMRSVTFKKVKTFVNLGDATFVIHEPIFFKVFLYKNSILCMFYSKFLHESFIYICVCIYVYFNIVKCYYLKYIFTLCK